MTTDLPVDVVVPAWGGYLEHLDATLRSTGPARTRIVVTDDPAAASRAGAERVVRFRPGAGGVAAAREAGLDHVEAPYVLFLDADDELLPGALDRLTATARSDERLVGVAGGFRRFSDGQNWPPPALGRLATTPLGVPLLLARNALPAVGACVLRVDALPRPLFPSVEDEDWHAAIRIRARGAVRYDPQPALLYRDHAGSVSRRARDAEALAISHSGLLASAEEARGRTSRWWRAADRAVAGYRGRRTQVLLASWGCTDGAAHGDPDH